MDDARQRILQAMAQGVAEVLPTFHEPTGRFLWPSAAFSPYAADGAAPFGSERGILAARIDGRPIHWVMEVGGRPRESA